VVTLWANGRTECTCEAGVHKRECHHLETARTYLRVYCESNADARKDFAVLLGLSEPDEEAEADAGLAALAGETFEPPAAA
jgi:uncharacterized protein (DUF169 family)